MNPSGESGAARLTAARAHSGQRRKGREGRPYINHPLEVADMVARDGAGEDEIVAALLHDVVEDSEMTLDQLRERFGDAVAALVGELTDDPAWAGLPRPERKRRQAGEFARASTGARRIKVADQTSNIADIAREPEAWSPEDAATYLGGAEAVVAACRGVSPGLEAAFDTMAAEAMQKIGHAP